MTPKQSVFALAVNVRNEQALLDSETVTAAILDVNLDRELSLAEAPRLEQKRLQTI